jgi:hypothetical protein
MAAEIIGLEKITKYINKYDFQKIKLSKGNEVVYVKRTKEGESQTDLVEDFTDFCDEFIAPNNFRDYKLELFGTYNESPNAKLSPVIKATVAFYEKATVTGGYETKQRDHYNNQPIDVDKYVQVATENATLKAQLERLEEKLDEMIADEDEDEEPVGASEPETIGAALNRALISKLDTVVDVVLARLAMPAMSQSLPISGIESDVLTEFRSIYPDIDEDLKRLLVLAKNQPDFFKTLIITLRNMVQ